MSAEGLSNRLANHIKDRARELAHREALPLLFEGFNTDLLLEADDKAGHKVTGICAETAIKAADRRLAKIKPIHNPGFVLLTDFIPAFEYISELCVPRNQFRFPVEHVSVFTREISELIRQGCPWC